MLNAAAAVYTLSVIVVIGKFAAATGIGVGAEPISAAEIDETIVESDPSDSVLCEDDDIRENQVLGGPALWVESAILKGGVEAVLPCSSRENKQVVRAPRFRLTRIAPDPESRG